MPILAMALAVQAGAEDVSAPGADSAMTPAFTSDQVAAGVALYELHCATCHGPHMREPGGGYFDLRKFPPDRKPRFVNSVSNGKNSMPPWRSLLTQTDIDRLWAYVVAGEKDEQ
jgi:mono/diheme cytochrome c family protein